MNLEERKALLEQIHAEKMAKIHAEEERQSQLAEIDRQLGALRLKRNQILSEMEPLMEARGKLVRRKKGS
jgi:hypothetical protein